MKRCFAVARLRTCSPRFWKDRCHVSAPSCVILSWYLLDFAIWYQTLFTPISSPAMPPLRVAFLGDSWVTDFEVTDEGPLLCFGQFGVWSRRPSWRLSELLVLLVLVLTRFWRVFRS